MTRIIPENIIKGHVFKSGQIITVEDVDILKKIGRKNINVADNGGFGQEWVHEDEVALTFAPGYGGRWSYFHRGSHRGQSHPPGRAGWAVSVVDESRLEILKLPATSCGESPTV